MSDFYRYFKENMDALGLPAPESLYGTLQAAVANAAILLGHLDNLLVHQQHLSRPWLRGTLQRWPGTYKDAPGRCMYRQAAMR